MYKLFKTKSFKSKLFKPKNKKRILHDLKDISYYYLNNVFVNHCASTDVTSFDIAKFLIIHKLIDINYRDENGNTALMYLAVSNFHKQVQFLLDHGADANIKDNLGGDALNDAETYSSRESIEILKKYTLR